ncbi:MAG: hypothetical protein JO197_22205 [Acidobacteria bacterium]|nr:hypothetical protein [Acidobacteriota bacterium]MBV9474851.1 hypothetical protein [Acidobacteriota bacterium]
MFRNNEILLTQPLAATPRLHAAPVTWCGAEQNEWCWAATVQMVLKSRGSTRSQCEIVQTFLQDASLDCCTRPFRCNVSCDSRDFETLVCPTEGLTVSPAPQPQLSFAEIQTNVVDENKLLILGFRRASGRRVTGHMALVVGVSAPDQVMILDCAKNNSTGAVPRPHLPTGYYGTWVQTWIVD